MCQTRECKFILKTSNTLDVGTHISGEQINVWQTHIKQRLRDLKVLQRQKIQRNELNQDISFDCENTSTLHYTWCFYQPSFCQSSSKETRQTSSPSDKVLIAWSWLWFCRSSPSWIEPWLRVPKPILYYHICSVFVFASVSLVIWFS